MAASSWRRRGDHSILGRSSARAEEIDLVVRVRIEGRQRPNLKSEDSGLRHRFSEAKVSLWMCENGTGHEESRGPTRR